MQIEQVRLKNFKLFREAQFDLRRLTLLTGTNSSGKSTILHAITAILQSQEAGLFPLEFQATGANCGLGSFRDIVHGRRVKESFGLGLSFSSGNRRAEVDGEFRYSSAGNQTLPQRLAFRDKNPGKGDEVLEVRWNGQEVGYEARAQSPRFVRTMRSGAPLILARALEQLSGSRVKRDVGEGDEVTIDELQAKFDADIARLDQWFVLKSRKASEMRAELKDISPVSYVMATLEDAMGAVSQQCGYIGPVRAYPERYYFVGNEPKRISPRGDEAIALLYDWKRHAPRKYALVLDILKTLELVSAADADESLEEVLRFDVQPFAHSERVSFADVGFGISQVLPILVADVGLPSRGTMMVNQPEVHLHPSSQALLANYFVSRLEERQYILETHSEYLINRLRLLRAEGKVKADELCIIYLEAVRRRRPKVYQITIDEDGSLRNAPKSFFETYFLDTFGITTSGFAASSGER